MFKAPYAFDPKAGTIGFFLNRVFGFFKKKQVNVVVIGLTSTTKLKGETQQR
jgi:hypothetical protein